MFEAWGRALYTRRRLTLGIVLVLVAFAAVWGTGVFGKLSAGNSFTPPDSQSQRESDQASQVFGRNDADARSVSHVEPPGCGAGATMAGRRGNSSR